MTEVPRIQAAVSGEFGFASIRDAPPMVCGRAAVSRSQVRAAEAAVDDVPKSGSGTSTLTAWVQPVTVATIAAAAETFRNSETRACRVRSLTPVGVELRRMY